MKNNNETNETKGTKLFIPLFFFFKSTHRKERNEFLIPARSTNSLRATASRQTPGICALQVGRLRLSLWVGLRVSVCESVQTNLNIGTSEKGKNNAPTPKKGPKKFFQWDCFWACANIKGPPKNVWPLKQPQRHLVLGYFRRHAARRPQLCRRPRATR